MPLVNKFKCTKYYYKIITSDYDLYDIINDHELSCVCKGNIDNSALQNVNLFFLLHVGHCCQCYHQVDVEI